MERSGSGGKPVRPGGSSPFRANRSTRALTPARPMEGQGILSVIAVQALDFEEVAARRESAGEAQRPFCALSPQDCHHKALAVSQHELDGSVRDGFDREDTNGGARRLLAAEIVIPRVDLVDNGIVFCRTRRLKGGRAQLEGWRALAGIEGRDFDDNGGHLLGPGRRQCEHGNEGQCGDDVDRTMEAKVLRRHGSPSRGEPGARTMDQVVSGFRAVRGTPPGGLFSRPADVRGRVISPLVGLYRSLTTGRAEVAGWGR